VGAEPARPDIPGLGEARAVWAGDVCSGEAETGDRVVVAGGGGIGCETALHLARQGKKVVVVEMLPEAALDFNFINRGMLLDLLSEAGVEVRTGMKVVEIRGDGVTVEPTGAGPGSAPGSPAAGARVDIPADTVVLALGMTPRTVMVEALRAAAPRVSVVGDCAAPRFIIDAVREGFHAVAEL
jgi:NADPH-dependent 2,4-dienoyl-CoA reductase/sulfur reductase-like enzyme